MQAEPTSWNFNPIAPTNNVVEYDSATREYDLANQPYDGYAAGVNPYNWKNPAAWQNSLVYPAQQQYYGGPSYVPLYGGPTNWVANAGIVNQSGQYVPSQGAYINLRPYDGSTTGDGYSNPATTYSDPTATYSGTQSGATYIYDSSEFDYDGTNNGESFANWKTPVLWTPISGGNDF